MMKILTKKRNLHNNNTNSDRCEWITSISSTGVGSTVGVPFASCSAFIASVPGLNSNDYYSKLKLIEQN